MEKERYTIESFEIDEPSCIFDNKTQQRILSLVEYNYDEITNLKNLLNQQDARIKVLEEENQQLKEQLKDKSNTIQNLLELQTIMESSCGYQMFLDCQDEIEQLKQSQNQKAIELLEKVKNYFVVEEIDEDGIATGDWTIIHDSCSVAEYIDSQIKYLKG